MIKANTEKVKKLFDRPILVRTKETEWDRRVKLTNSFPTIEPAADGNSLELRDRLFPVMPFPNSRLSDVVINAATGEEELVRIYNRPTWAPGFKAERCLVVMTSFFEPAYWGSEAGTVQEFSSNEDEILLVAAIKIKPIKPATGQRDAVSLLTHVPSEFMLQYHQRLLVFLKPDAGVEWISGGAVGGNTDPQKKFDFLLANRH
ncbi:MAG: SOS response-associated peptidase family protein, partial [Bdellovibrionota bacterium]